MFSDYILSKFKCCVKQVTREYIMTENKAIKIIQNPSSSKYNLEIALLVLSHSSKDDAIKAIETFIKVNQNPDLAFWAETALGECLYFKD